MDGLHGHACPCATPPHKSRNRSSRPGSGLAGDPLWAHEWGPRHEGQARPGLWWQPVQTIRRPRHTENCAAAPAEAPRTAQLQVD